jgi:hypothetical protein
MKQWARTKRQATRDLQSVNLRLVLIPCTNGLVAGIQGTVLTVYSDKYVTKIQKVSIYGVHHLPIVI